MVPKCDGIYNSVPYNHSVMDDLCDRDGKIGAEYIQGFQSADSIQAINLLTSGLFTVNTMWTD